MNDEEGPVDPASVRRERRGTGRRRKGLLREATETMLLALVMFLSVRTVGAAYEVDGISMAPSLHDHQRLFVTRAAYAHLDLRGLLDLLPGEDRAGDTVWYPFEPPARGDVVVLESPEGGDQPLIKRVVALPGERVAFSRGAVLVDGQPLAEPYIGPDVRTTCRGREVCELVVPAGHVYVLGDNRGNSNDSRDFGAVATDRLFGKAVVSFWPLEAAGRLPEHDFPTLPGGDS